MNPRRAITAITLLTALVFNAGAVTRYVDLNSPSPTPPYTNWPTAATNIQDAVDAAVAGDILFVTNGVYATGGRAVYGSSTNRVAINKAIAVESVNGPGVTVIQGYQVPVTTNGDSAVRCVYLTNGVRLVGFTLTKGATRILGNGDREASGGGAWCESGSATLSNCVVTANSSGYGGGGIYSGAIVGCLINSNSVLSGREWGGGAWNSILTRCELRFNTAYIGGGAYAGQLNNCLVIGNKSSNGGGTADAELNNCTVVSNSATTSGGGAGYNATFRTLYFNAIRELCGGVLNADTTGNPNPPFYQFVDYHLGRWLDTGVAATARDGMKTFMTQRQAYLLGLIGSPAIPLSFASSAM